MEDGLHEDDSRAYKDGQSIGQQNYAMVDHHLLEHWVRSHVLELNEHIRSKVSRLCYSEFEQDLISRLKAMR